MREVESKEEKLLSHKSLNKIKIFFNNTIIFYSMKVKNFI